MNAFQRTSECLEIDELVGALDGADEQHKRRVESHIAGVRTLPYGAGVVSRV